MSAYSYQKKKRRNTHHSIKFKSIGNHEEFLERITKTLYYAKFPLTERLSLPLSELAVELYSEAKCGRSLERLRLEETSEISRNACISPCSLVLAMFYLEQLKTTNPPYIDKVAPSDLFLISLMVATKFLNDSGEEDDVLNSEWATSAGLSASHVNKLEQEFLAAIGWKLFVKDNDFWKKLRFIEGKIALSEGRRRGWFSYTELEILLDQINAFLLAQAVFTVSAVCLVSYAAGMLTVIGSTMISTQLLYVPTQHGISDRIQTHYTPHCNSLRQCQNSSLPFRDTEKYINRTVPDNINLPLIPSCRGKYIQNEENSDTKIENITDFYNSFLVPISYNLLNFQQHWKHPSMYLLSE